MANAHEESVSQTHTSPAQYVVVGIALCVLTAFEIILYYQESSISKNILITGLLSISVIKFTLVAAYFMHLKNDPKLFRRWFIIGGLAALAIFVAVLASMNIQDHRFF